MPNFSSAQTDNLVDACKVTAIGDDPMIGHLYNTITHGTGDTEDIFRADDLYISPGRNSNTNIRRAMTIFKCINEQSKIDDTGIVLTINSEEIEITENFNDLKDEIDAYQIINHLPQTGIIDVPTSFQMGHDIGKIYMKYKGENTSCDPMTMFTSEKTLLKSNIDSDGTNKESFEAVIGCVINPSGNDKPFAYLSNRNIPVTEEQNSSLTETKYSTLIHNGTEGGIALIYNLGVYSGYNGQQALPINSNENGGSGDIETVDLNSCSSLKFSKNSLFLSETEGDINDKKIANQILGCLDQLENSDIRHYSDIYDITNYDINSTSCNQDLVRAFQKSIQYISGEKLYDEMEKQGISTDDNSPIEISTAFHMGLEMGKVIKDNNPQLESLCFNSYVSFTPAHSISKQNEGIPNIGIYESDKNIPPLGELLDCLHSELNYKALGTHQSLPSAPFSKLYYSNVLEKQLIEDTPERQKESGGPISRVGVNIAYELGLLFGKFGGVGESSETLREEQKIDPCAEVNAQSLEDNIHLYSSNNINFIPRNPGILDWRDVTEEGTNECLTESELAASLVGRIIRFAEAFVAIIAVIMFIYGGFLYVTAHGDESQSQKALKTIYISAGGVFIILLSRFITEILVPLSDDGISIDKSKAFSTDAIANQQIAAITNWLLGFSSFVAISMLIYGGYLWMVSGGDESLETKAKSIFRTALIGFVIIFSAYTITMVVLGGAGITN